MARSTQMRLDAITGSLTAIDEVSSTNAAAAAIASSDLQGVLGQFAGAIKRIHGDAAFTNQSAGRFDHVAAQFTGHLSASSDIVGGQDLALTRNADVGGTADLRGRVKAYVAAEVVGVLTASNNVLLNKSGTTLVSKTGGHVIFDVAGLNAFKISANGAASLDVLSGAIQAYGNLDVDGRATLNSALVENMSTTAGALVFHDAAKILADNINVKFDGSHLYAPGVKVSDLTPGRVVFAGASEELADDASMTYDSTNDILTVKGSTFSEDVSIARDLTIAGNLLVQGATVTVNVGELVIEDKIITVASGAAGATLDGAGLQLGLGAEQTFAWNHSGSKWIASTKLCAAAVQVTGLSSAPVAVDASGNIVEVDFDSLVLGTANQVIVAQSGTDNHGITLSLPQSIDTDADVEFDTLKLGDYAADAGKAYMIGASGSIVSAAYDQFVMVAPDLGLATSQDGFKIKITQSQDLRSSASPEFAAINLGAYGDLLASGSDLKIQAAAFIKFADSQGNYELAKAGEYATFDAAFAATSIVGALVELASGSGGGKGKWCEILAADTAGAYTLTGPNWSGMDTSRVDIYLNGQLMKLSDDYALSGSATVTFTFALKIDDVVTARIC